MFISNPTFITPSCSETSTPEGSDYCRKRNV